MMKEKYFCRTCKGHRNHKEIQDVTKRGSEDDGYFQWTHSFKLIECLGCETISFLEIYGDTEMIGHDEDGNPDYFNNTTIYPPYLEKSSELDYLYYVPESIKNIYKETLSSFKSNLYILTAGGLRAIIEAVCNHLKIKKGSLADRIDSLHSGGHLTKSESRRLHSIRFLGNDALHEIERPLKEHLYILLDIINHLLANLFINDKKMKGKMDTIIDKYEEYLKLIRNRITKDIIGKEFTVNQLLGKSRRLIDSKLAKEFEAKLEKEIDSGNHDFISIIDRTKETVYKIMKVPEFVFEW